jgi:putative ABC transport system ATP-binding protein
MSAAIEINDLKFAYGAHPPVLDIKTLSISQGERVFIYGPSGCGKTTLLGLIAGVLDLQDGALSLLGNKMETKTHIEKDQFRGAHMGYIFQMFNLIPYLNAFENIVLPCKLTPERQKRLHGDMKSDVEQIAKRLGITQILDRRVTDLSVGQQQRVAAARALLGHPEIIIADEPTSALDADHRKSFLNVLLDQAKASQATVLFVSHDRELSKFFDRSISIPEINLAKQSGGEG